MRNLCKFFGASLAVLGAVVFIGAGYAADSSGRAGYNVRTLNRTGTAQDTSSPRMPTMPTLSINTVGNLSTNVPTGDVIINDDDDDNQYYEIECPDGGVANSTYTVENCMTDILSCINNGALPGGLNDLFNEEMRNDILNGMGLCVVQVEKCIKEVRQNCKNLYLSSSDVWLDFNARRVQPEYYNFVLRKTGLTPNQAENTCWLLDKNVYGSSFTAVGAQNNVTSEYNNAVYAYNDQSSSGKSSPQGAQINTNSSIDVNRGHYARWDATTAECLIRVAAYNKGNQIKNSWLFGAVGNDEPAEVWQKTGDTFICNKDLFGFSLMNNTNTVAVVGIGGGTLVGAGIGAIAGHGANAFDCSKKRHRETLTDLLRNDSNIGIVNEYLDKDKMTVTVDIITEKQCESVVGLYNRYSQVKSALQYCNGNSEDKGNIAANFAFKVECEINNNYTLENCFEEKYPCCAGQNIQDISGCMTRMVSAVKDCLTDHYDNISSCAGSLGAEITGELQKAVKIQKSVNENGCSFNPLNLDKAKGEGIYCKDSKNESCRSSEQIESDIERLDDVFTSDLSDLLQKGEDDSNLLKSTLIGAGIGAGTGGLATAITAFVERNNISCHVGDALAEVAYGKSYSIGSLKDFYVKWNLNLPDTDLPTLVVSDCDSWKRACARLTDLNQCKSASANYKPAGKTFSTFVQNACSAQGTECVINKESAQNAGACGVNVGVVDPGVNVGVVDLGNINNNLNAM